MASFSPFAHTRPWQLWAAAALILSLLFVAAAAGAAAPEYFTVRPDIRRCIAPLCGGYFIDPVNRSRLRCADGERRQECYVADIDLGALGPEASLSVSPLDPPAVVRGVLEKSKFEPADAVLFTLVASELWEPATGAEAGRRFVRLSDSGIRCFTEPCPSTLAEVLNRDRRRLLEAVDLSLVKLDDRQLEEARAAIASDEGLVAAGGFFRLPGKPRASRGLGFVASEVYFPFLPALLCETDSDCPEDRWCRRGSDGASGCVPFVAPGESCGGFVLPWYFERCEPGLVCVPSEPTGDLPGTCATCNVGGTPYQEGESFPADDGCNVCSCLAGGRVACTEIGCNPPACLVTGCSAQLCVDAKLGPIDTTCEYRAEYGCLQHSRCGSFGPAGSCAWQETPEYLMCLDDIASPGVSRLAPLP